MSTNHKSHKRLAARPQLVVGGTSTQETFRSADDRRVRTRMGVVDDTVAPSTQEDVSFWHYEDMATSHARMDPHFTYQLGDTSLSCEPDAPLEDGIEVVLPPATKNPNTEWTGSHFKRDRKGLKELGLRIQLNHPPGVICTFRDPGPADFVLYDVTGVHEITVDFCGCHPRWSPTPGTARTAAPRLLVAGNNPHAEDVLNCLGKLSAYDFLWGLEKCTKNDGLQPTTGPPQTFYAHHEAVAGGEAHEAVKRGYDTGGVKATKQGELALKCHACSQPGGIYPRAGIKSIRFIGYQIAMCPRKSRIRSLATGSDFSASERGRMDTRPHIAKNANEQEISNCSGFQAMFMANTKRVKGLQTTGIGGVTCSCHNMWQGNGIGDLQVGERYWQYGLSAALGLIRIPTTLRPHKPKCHAPFSFHFMWGAGMTHGEGVEQNWAFSNGAASSTRLMGPGARQATLEDVFGFHNYDRVLAMHRVLPKRLAVSIKEGAKHQLVFDAFTKGLEESRPEEVAEWKQMVLRWEANPHPDHSESPFEKAEEVQTLRKIQLDIAAEEYLCIEMVSRLSGITHPAVFIMMGLALEEVQRKLEID
ncbi:hypothetical protein B0H14DRAFT_2654909, partial [Mycena olivaceomarginata]